MVCNVWTCLNRSFVTLAQLDKNHSGASRTVFLRCFPFLFDSPLGQVQAAQGDSLGEPEVFLSAVALYGQCGSRFFVKCAFLLEPMRFQVGSANLVKWNRWVPGGFCHFFGRLNCVELKVLSALCFSILSGKVIQICSNQQGSVRCWCFQARTSRA